MKPAAIAELDAVLDRARATAFYRDRVGDRDASAWFSLPLTSRAELVRDQLAHLPFGSRTSASAGDAVRAGATGSGDDLLVLSWSEHDLARERAAGTRMLSRVGVAPATPIANTLPGALVSPGSLLLGDVVEEHGALDVPLGAIESDAAAKAGWELVDRVRAAVLVLEGASATRFLAAGPPLERDWLQGIVLLQRSGGGAAVEVPAAVGFRGWQRSWLAVAEAASFAAATCARGRYHADTRLLAEASPQGSLLLTPLDGDVSLLRYDSGIGVRGLGEACDCGGDGVSFALA